MTDELTPRDRRSEPELSWFLVFHHRLQHASAASTHAASSTANRGEVHR